MRPASQTGSAAHSALAVKAKEMGGTPLETNEHISGLYDVSSGRTSMTICELHEQPYEMCHEYP